MKKNFPQYSFVALLFFSLVLSSCGPKAFTKGEYDDPEKVILLDDKWNENDMQLVSNRLVSSLVGSTIIQGEKERPLVMITQVKNRTSEHIDVKMLTNKVRTAVIKSGKFRFSDRDTRDELKEEYDYQSSKYVDQTTAAKIGRQIGVKYIINGDISSNVQQVGRDKVIYYKVTLNLINVETNVIEWADDTEIRKIYRKKTIVE